MFDIYYCCSYLLLLFLFTIAILLRWIVLYRGSYVVMVRVVEGLRLRRLLQLPELAIYSSYDSNKPTKQLVAL
jgi:hypothetical protein